MIVPPSINKYYILDLQPANSFVGHAVAEGHQVFLVSWRNMGAEQSTLTWDDYLEHGVLAAIDAALAITKADKANTLGFCIGGTLLASALAARAARGEHRAASMTLLTSMLDFGDTGDIGLLVTPEAVAAREAAIGKGGLVKGSELAQVFAALRSNDLIWPYVVNGYLKGKPPPAFDLLYWNSDGTNLPGPMFCWYLRNTYLENKLREPGATTALGEPVDLATIDVPTFVYASKEDHIVPWKTAYESTQLVGRRRLRARRERPHRRGDQPAREEQAQLLDGRFDPDAERWFEPRRRSRAAGGPPGTRGSRHTAVPRSTPARRRATPSSPPIEPAPGSYVKAKAE